jgi:hypothetical protein
MLKHVIVHSRGKAQSKLRSKAMEACTVIGDAVGKDVFHKDAHELMKILLDIMQENNHKSSSDDDTSEQFLLQAWARICNVLEKEFIPYLPSIIQGVFLTAKRNPVEIYSASTGNSITSSSSRAVFGNAVDLLDDDEHDSNGNDNDHDHEHVSQKASAAASSIEYGQRKRVVFNEDGTTTTTFQSAVVSGSGKDAIIDGQVKIGGEKLELALEDKAIACSMLCTFANTLKEGFFPYVLETSR